jgi:hypothetical protein
VGQALGIQNPMLLPPIKSARTSGFSHSRNSSAVQSGRSTVSDRETIVGTGRIYRPPSEIARRAFKAPVAHCLRMSVVVIRPGTTATGSVIAKLSSQFPSAATLTKPRLEPGSDHAHPARARQETKVGVWRRGVQRTATRRHRII